MGVGCDRWPFFDKAISQVTLPESIAVERKPFGVELPLTRGSCQIESQCGSGRVQIWQWS